MYYSLCTCIVNQNPPTIPLPSQWRALNDKGGGWWEQGRAFDTTCSYTRCRGGRAQDWLCGQDLGERSASLDLSLVFLSVQIASSAWLGRFSLYYHDVTHLAELQYTLDDLHSIRESMDDNLKRILEKSTPKKRTVWPQIGLCCTQIE